MLRVAISDAHGEGGTKLRAVAEALVSKAMTGDVAAIREIADRLDGKVPQGLEHTGHIETRTSELTDDDLERIATAEVASPDMSTLN